MKKNSLALILSLLFLCSCTSMSYQKLRMTIPSKSSLDLEQFKELLVANFLIKGETKDIDLNREITSYFSSEIGQVFKGKVSTKELSVEDAQLFEDENFWKNFSSDSKKSLALTGSAQYTEEIRKAILEKRRQRFEDPFPAEKSLSERRFYTLNLDLYLIDLESGKILYQRAFKESRGYDNPNQTSYFAFFDLIQAVKGKLFSTIFGEGKIQERYLISR